MQTWWTLSGTLLTQPRTPLARATVRVVGWPDERACAAVWGETTTDDAGRFRLRALRPRWAQRLWLRVALGTSGRWLTLALAPDAIDGPDVDAGAIVCARAHASVTRAASPAPRTAPCSAARARARSARRS